MIEPEGDSRGAKTQAALIARGKALAITEPNYARFLLYTARSLDREDLETQAPAVIEAELRRAYGWLEKRGTASHFIQLSMPDVLTLDAPEVIDIFAPDMPFIVDSVLAAIRARGVGVRLLAHPILPLDPQSYRVLNEPTETSRQESFLHLHIDPLPDEAARAAMLSEIAEVLDEVAQVVRGWRPILERLRQLVQDVRENPPPVDAGLVSEAVQFLGWLAAHNFTFLGLREYRLSGSGDGRQLEPLTGSGVGLLERPEAMFLRQGGALVDTTPEHLAFLAGPELVMLARANVRSRVHKRAYMDYIGIKQFSPDGQVSGEIRILGLFTSRSAVTPNVEVPLLRHKLASVLQRSETSPDSHAGKALLQALETYPREELFQIDEGELLHFATIATLADRPRVRVLPRVDRFDNYVSVFVFVPRDRYDSDRRAVIGNHLAERYAGYVSAYTPLFSDSDLVRVHFIIGRAGGPTPRPRRDDLEAEVGALVRDFGDRVVDAAGEPGDAEPFRRAFPPAYRAAATPGQALADIAVFRSIGDETALRLTLRADPGHLTLKVYHRVAPLPLSVRVPLLENFGFRVIDEQTHEITPSNEAVCYLHEMLLALPDGVARPDTADIARLEMALSAVWRHVAENDRFNALSLMAGLGWDDVALLRGLSAYLRQLRFGFSASYIARTLGSHPDATKALVSLFRARHLPDIAEDRAAATATARSQVEAALDHTASLDEDRIIRQLLGLVEAVLRSNFYQRDASGHRPPAIGFKFDGTTVPGLPEPRPFREIFVYSPRVEGIHLRFGPVARGGIRWSDRPEDFRTEALGLARVQQVKNAIIVPVGAKGAFVPTMLPATGDREAIRNEAIACYRTFISTLLDLTDNILASQVVPPPGIVRHDGDDPYLVVAADKGTAEFSDIANALAVERGYWLGDAFASGGATGYDHKKLGITARGAWEAVKRHFRELGQDIQATPFRVAGVGDMSGDVFGNGMLLSPHIRLVAAFDHRDIFIDPDPDPTRSLAERARLFRLPRSSWQDYDRKAISPGGGVYSRLLKQVDLSAEARSMLGLQGGTPLTPDDVLRAILQADVDLLWFGGIGTFVAGPEEAPAEIGDRANDAIRITGKQVRARVIGEGANLAVTPRGRVAYALRGGRIDTDAIDNSAGVNCSDLEVNLKIALDQAVAMHHLPLEQRNELLAMAASDVVALCIRNNYLQSLALSLAVRTAPGRLVDHRRLLAALESAGTVHRDIDALPTEPALDARAAAGRGLVRPELATLLGYAKLALRTALLGSPLIDDVYLGKYLFAYFPARLVEGQHQAIAAHRLKREIIATVLANLVINRGGPDFASAVQATTGAEPAAIVRACVAAHDAFELGDLYRRIDALDGAIAAEAQLELYAEVQRALNTQTLSLLRNEPTTGGLADLVTRQATDVLRLRQHLGDLLSPSLADRLGKRAASLQAAGIPADLAQAITELPALGFAGEAIAIATQGKADVIEAARAFFLVVEQFRLADFVDQARRLTPSDRFDQLALERAMAILLRAQRDLAVEFLASGEGPIESRLARWLDVRREAIDDVKAGLAEIVSGPASISRLSIAAGLVADLAAPSTTAPLPPPPMLGSEAGSIVVAPSST